MQERIARLADEIGTTKRRSMSQSRRLKIFENHYGVCCHCNGKIDGVREKWIVEHLRALGLGGEDEDSNCAPAHETCRRVKDKDDVKRISKAKRVKAKHIGAKKPSSFPGGRNSKLKKLFNGKVVER